MGKKSANEWRKEQGKIADYKREKKALCGVKRRVENERWEEEAKKAKTEEQIWRIVNRERKKWRRV